MAASNGYVVQLLVVFLGEGMSIVPTGSGLPELPSPSVRPTTAVECFLLAVVLRIADSRREGYVSQRELVELLNRVGRGPVTEYLHGLRVSHFVRRLNQREFQRVTEADVYAPGTKLRGQFGVAWHSLSEMLLGDGGLCDGLWRRDAFGTRLLGTNGLLVVATLREALKPLSVREIHRYLGMFIASETTVRNRLSYAAKYKLVERVGSKWQLTDDFQGNLARYELASGAKKRKLRSKTKHRDDRRKFSGFSRHLKLTTEQEDALRADGCIYCGRTNADHLREFGAPLVIEHFPPRHWLSHWGLNDHPDFNWAICKHENSRLGTKLRGTTPPPLQRERTLFANDATKLEKIAAGKLHVTIPQYYDALNHDEPRRAGRIAQVAASLWYVVVSNPEALRVHHIGRPRRGSRRHERKVRIFSAPTAVRNSGTLSHRRRTVRK